MELEKDLALRVQEVAELRRRLESSKPAGDVDMSLSLLQEISALQEELEATHSDHQKEVTSLRESFGAREETHQKELKALQATTEELSKKNESLKSKLDHANKENSDVSEDFSYVTVRAWPIPYSLEERLEPGCF